MAKSKQAGYSSSRNWKGRTLYDCDSCAYNTLVKDNIEEHVRVAHPRAADGSADTESGDSSGSTGGSKSGPSKNSKNGAGKSGGK